MPITLNLRGISLHETSSNVLDFLKRSFDFLFKIRWIFGILFFILAIKFNSPNYSKSTMFIFLILALAVFESYHDFLFKKKHKSKD